MRIIIAGSRKLDGDDIYQLLEKNCIDIISKLQYDNGISSSDIEIISGNAKGIDKLGERFAKEHKLKLKLFPANWKDMSWPCIIGHNEYGDYNKMAGAKRNSQMAKYAGESSGILIAFDAGTSGTKNMIKMAKEEGIQIYKIDCRK